MQTGYPDTSGWPRWGRRNLFNALLVLVVPLPAIACTWLLYHAFPPGSVPPSPDFAAIGGASDLAAWLLHRPVLTANLFFFAFVDAAFFAIALAQRSSWLIDPYWTILPPLLAWLYLVHPLARPDPVRAVLACVPLLVWSVRLTANYFRRESWCFGLREDWRYAKMRRERPHFWIEQFAVVHLAQHAMLVGLSLPYWAVAFRPEPVGIADVLCCAGALLGIAVAGAADGQLDRFMRENEARRQRGEPAVVLLDTGIWRYARHPNYFGEQLFWWCIAGFGIVLGEPWVALGTLFNSCVLAGVTVMTEQRMLAVPARAAAYADYRRRTSVWVPWPPRPRAEE